MTGFAAHPQKPMLEALTIDHPERIVTANVGCQAHLQDTDGVPVVHWIDLLEQDLRQ